ncbi:MAG: Flp family type IVb pilin [Pseudomonadota bacterium]
MVCKVFRAFLHNENGATAVEYALLLGLIALAIVGALTNASGSINSVFSTVGSHI